MSDAPLTPDAFRALPRVERARIALELCAVQRLTYQEAAERLGLSRQSVSDLIADPDGSKARERKKRYQGVCVECGGPTTGSDGRAKAPLRCAACHQGKGWHRPPDMRRRVPVRLCDLDLETRMEGAEAACRAESDSSERAFIVLAAVAPSTNVYWVAE